MHFCARRERFRAATAHLPVRALVKQRGGSHIFTRATRREPSITAAMLRESPGRHPDPWRPIPARAREHPALDERRPCPASPTRARRRLRTAAPRCAATAPRRRRTDQVPDIVEAPRPPRSTSWTSASSGTFERADARSTRTSTSVVGRVSTPRARRRKSYEPKRNMQRALVGETPHVQGSRHREPTVASPGTTFAQRAAAPSRSTPWTPTRAASWRGAAVLAP